MKMSLIQQMGQCSEYNQILKPYCTLLLRKRRLGKKQKPSATCKEEIQLQFTMINRNSLCSIPQEARAMFGQDYMTETPKTSLNGLTAPLMIMISGDQVSQITREMKIVQPLTEVTENFMTEIVLVVTPLYVVFHIVAQLTRSVVLMEFHRIRLIWDLLKHVLKQRYTHGLNSLLYAQWLLMRQILLMVLLSI